MNVENINITMGFPLKEIGISQLFDHLFWLHINGQKFSQEDEKKFYYRDVVNLLKDPFINKLTKGSSQLNFFGIIHAQVNLLFALQDRVCFRFSHDGNICDVVCFCLVAK